MAKIILHTWFYCHVGKTAWDRRLCCQRLVTIGFIWWLYWMSVFGAIELTEIWNWSEPPRGSERHIDACKVAWKRPLSQILLFCYDYVRHWDILSVTHLLLLNCLLMFLFFQQHELSFCFDQGAMCFRLHFGLSCVQIRPSHFLLLCNFPSFLIERLFKPSAPVSLCQIVPGSVVCLARAL